MLRWRLAWHRFCTRHFLIARAQRSRSLSALPAASAFFSTVWELGVRGEGGWEVKRMDRGRRGLPGRLEGGVYFISFLRCQVADPCRYGQCHATSNLLFASEKLMRQLTCQPSYLTASSGILVSLCSYEIYTSNSLDKNTNIRNEKKKIQSH